MSVQTQEEMISRQKLLEAAARVFAESGFRGATTRRIAEAAGVNEVTLFRLFGSKSQLLSEAMNCMHPNLAMELPQVPGDVEAELTEWATAHLEAMRSMRHIIRKTMAELEEHPEMRQVVCDAKTPMFNQLATYVSLAWPPTSADEQAFQRTAVSMLASSMFSDAIGRDVVSTAYPAHPEEAARQYVAVFLRLMGPGRGVPAAGRRMVGVVND
jgi:AcrR family transcriptional regulator